MDPSAPTTAMQPRRRFRQISLRTLLLLTAAVAVWVAYGKNRYDNARFARQIEAMRPMARELIVEDPSQIAVVKREERWYDQNDWQLYLPPGKYRLCIATREIGEPGMAPITKSVPLSQGRHEVALEQKRAPDKSWQVLVTIDGEEVIQADEPAEWDPGHGSSGGGMHSSLTQLPPAEPAVLFRRRFTVRGPTGSFSTPKEPSNGVLLWIEKEKEPR